MRLHVKGKNHEVSDSIRRYAEEKLGKLDRQLHELTQVELELCVEKNPSISQNQVAEATVWTKGPTLRAREASTDMKASIDQLTEKLLRQVEHYRAKRSRRPARGNGIPPGGSMNIEAEGIQGDAVEFVTLADGTLVVEREDGDAELAPLADAVELEVSRPYRAQAVRKSASLWAVAARRIDVAQFAAQGDELELTAHEGERTLL